MLKTSLFAVVLFFVTGVFAGEIKPNSTLKSGAAILEYPRGQFQENAVPQFFKWNVMQRDLKSIAIKVFRARPDGTYDQENDLIGRFDFLPNTQSMNWPHAQFVRGKYVWVVESYNDQDPHPIYIDSTSFEVEGIKHMSLQTKKMGLLVGFSRGKYSSEDPNYNLDFDTTPTFYGGVLKGGRENTLWESFAFASDFILQGAVYRSFTLGGAHTWGLNKKKIYELECFVGPALRAMMFPRVRSSDGSAIYKKDIWVINPGVEFVLQRQFDQHITFFSKVILDLNAFGTDPVIFELNQANFNFNAGLLYGLFWPIGFSGEFQYKRDNTKTRDGSATVETHLQEWSVAANLYYAF